MGNIPTINIVGKTLPEAWEKAVIAVYEQGLDIKTQYDKPEDPPSKDATVMITVEDPFAEPRIHKNFSGGPEELASYNGEVLDGIHNHWIDPENGKWTYTYNERLFKYSPTEDLKDSKSPRPFEDVDQIQYIIDNLASSNYSRRAQGITWQPTCDPKTYDPPCLQRLWCRMPEANDGVLVLNMNSHWRSRDLYRAWFMNSYAMTNLQKRMANKIEKKLGREVRVGRYVDISDSLHLYGSYIEDIKPEIDKMRQKPIFTEKPSNIYTETYLEKIKNNIEQRTWPSDHPAFVMMTVEAEEKLAENPDCYAHPDA